MADGGRVFFIGDFVKSFPTIHNSSSDIVPSDYSFWPDSFCFLCTRQ